MTNAKYTVLKKIQQMLLCNLYFSGKDKPKINKLINVWKNNQSAKNNLKNNLYETIPVL